MREKELADKRAREAAQIKAKAEKRIAKIAQNSFLALKARRKFHLELKVFFKILYILFCHLISFIFVDNK